jgi:hypothetical protein
VSTSKRRHMRARPALIVRPLFVSQETAFAVLGITPRKFLESVVPMCTGFVVRVGRSALVPADVAEEALRGRATRTGSEDPELTTHLEDADGELQTADEILRVIGRKRIP